MNWQQIVLVVLAGSVIGYITNWIAIRMLFRPLCEKRLWGMRVPFTPGVIPRGKGRLARAIGEAVGGTLLAEEKVVQHLLQPEAEEQMRRYLANSMAGVRERGISVGEALGEHGGESLFLPVLTELFSDLAVKLARSESSRRVVNRLVQEAADYLLDQTLAAMVGEGGSGGIADTLEQLPASILRQPAVQQELQRRLAVQIESFFNSPQAVGYYLPGAVQEGIHQFVDDQAPRIIEAIEQYVDSPAARKAIKGRMEDFFDGSSVKRFVNGLFQLMGNSTDALVQRLGSEIARFFADEKNRAEIVKRLHLLVDEVLEKSIGDIAAGLDDAGKRERATEIAAWAMAKLCDSGVASALAGAIREILDKNRSRTWREIIDQVNPACLAGLSASLNRLVDRLWAQDVFLHKVDALVRREIDAVWQLPLNRVLDYLPASFVTDRDGMATRLYRYLVQRQVPGLLRFADIRGMVRQRVEELDELQVEELLLGIMRRELVAITWLGALLGAILGVATVVMQYMMK